MYTTGNAFWENLHAGNWLSKYVKIPDFKIENVRYGFLVK